MQNQEIESGPPTKKKVCKVGKLTDIISALYYELNTILALTYLYTNYGRLINW